MGLAYIQNRLEHAITIVLDATFVEARWDELLALIDEKNKPTPQDYVLDMRPLTFISSQMLGLLLELNGRLTAKGTHLRLVVAKQSRVSQVLLLANMHRLIPLSEG